MFKSLNGETFLFLQTRTLFRSHSNVMPLLYFKFFAFILAPMNVSAFAAPPPAKASNLIKIAGIVKIRNQYVHPVALGGLVVSVLATGPKVRGSNPAEVDVNGY
jgi:hypothetical protein